jgi:hypothetical protein
MEGEGEGEGEGGSRAMELAERGSFGWVWRDTAASASLWQEAAALGLLRTQYSDTYSGRHEDAECY